MVLEAAKVLCDSNALRERMLGADILGQLGIPDRTFPEECFQTLKKMLAKEEDEGVLQAITIAFSHLQDLRAVELVAPLRRHSNPDVRFAVVRGITQHGSDLAISTLIQLLGDQDNNVRDWATFGLGSIIKTDSQEIRTALLARLSDSDEDVRAEAMVGLAIRKDIRVLDMVIEELESSDVGILALEAAEELADPRLVPALLELKAAWSGNGDQHTRRLYEALAACLPQANA
jgi:HEAT repeat protein